MTSTNDFPTADVELRHLLVVSDYARAGALPDRSAPVEAATLERRTKVE